MNQKLYIINGKWKKHLHELIDLQPIELKDRGKRFDEYCYESLEEAVDDIFESIKDKIDKDDYAVYRHSMGSLLAYELHHKINELNIKKLGYLYVFSIN